MNKDVKILCCYYVDNDFVPTSDIYMPIQCGKAYTQKELGIPGDDTGDNISDRNTYWSEITGLYWAWKNMKPVKYIGLCSYRRFFNFKRGLFKPMVEIHPKKDYQIVNDIRMPNIPSILGNYDVIMPKKYWYAYSSRNVCRMNYHIEDFDILKSIIHEKYPDYDESFDFVFRRNNYWYGHNMFIMKWEKFDAYCNWVFDILLEAERRIDASNYTVDKIRVFGYMHELLLSLYVLKNNLKIYESQLTWITDDAGGFKFNSMLYKIACNCSFFFNKPRS